MRTTAGTFDETEASARKIAAVVYGLQALGLFVGLTYIAGAVVNYVKAAEVRGTWIESHFRWQLRTFWFSLLWAAIGVITYVLVVGYFILMADAVWVIYRIAKGAFYLRGSRAMYA